jgi:type II secretory pathway pseudopilin PulG
MIVVAIIGLLAAIGIPSILGAYKNAQDNTKLRNVADVEKAKGQITLPAGSVAGAIGAVPTTNNVLTPDQLTAMMVALKIDAWSELTVGGTTIDQGDWTTKASY